MSDSDKSAAKIEKKIAKSLAKHEKKCTVEKAEGASDATSSPTPAERSATAAEKQVRLQSYRVWFAALGVIVAIATLLITFKPWQ